VWTLNIWAWLLLYPSVTRKALQTFDCIELLGETYVITLTYFHPDPNSNPPLALALVLPLPLP
jgi:hypothetical protein